ncbi:MAG: cysteine hydrolase family protein [bacterium]
MTKLKTALLVIDMQNAMLHPEGENYYPDAVAVIDPVLKLIEAARKNKTLIVHVADRHREFYADYEHKRLPTHTVTGGFDAAFFDGFGPAKGSLEVEIVKRRYSAFFSTELALFLAEQQIDQVIIVGVKTNVCVRATAQDAFAYGFSVVVPREATNSNRSHLAKASLEDIDRYIGKVVKLDDAIHILS